MKKVLLIIYLFVARLVFGQQIPETNIAVHISNNDKTIVAEVRPLKSLPTPEPSNYYYWYSSNVIHQTQGGYSGKLLNGTYNEYYPNKNIKEQGAFNKGLKNGTWKSWDDNGNLKQLFTYCNGQKTGPFSIYNETGLLVQSGKYSNDQLDGKITFYSKDSTRVVTYKNGKTVMASQHHFWDKFNFLKKKNGKPTTAKAQKK